MASDLEIINSIKQLNNQEFQALAEASVLFVNDTNKLERLNTLNKSLAQVENAREIAKFLIKAFSLAVRQNVLDQTKLEKFLLSNFGFDVDEEKSNIIKSLWQKHAESLKESAEESNKSLMISQLVDMEWKFGVTSSTSSINMFGGAFLQLKLVYNKGNKLESKFLEMDLPQFYSFLHEMNKAKSQMDYLS